MEQITPETAPVGARILIQERGNCYAAPDEVVVVEWAPSGSYVKLRHRNGAELWNRDVVRIGVLVETLPPLEARIEAAIEKAAPKWGE
jgi:hypothetical protein